MLCGEQALDMFKSLLKINATKVTHILTPESAAKIHRDPPLQQRPTSQNSHVLGLPPLLPVLDEFHVNILHGGRLGQNC